MPFLNAKMSDSEEEFSDGDIDDIFGESDDEEFEGFNFQLPDVMEWVVNDD